MSAARSPRVICGAGIDRRDTRPADAPARCARARASSFASTASLGSSGSASAYACSAPSRSPLAASRSSPTCTHATRRRRRRGPAPCGSRSSAASALPLLALRRPRSSRYRNGAVGRAGDRARIRRAASSSLPVGRGLARGGQVLVEAAELQHLDAALDVGETTGRRPPPTRNANSASLSRFERQKRLAAADERRTHRGRRSASAFSKCGERVALASLRASSR